MTNHRRRPTRRHPVFATVVSLGVGATLGYAQAPALPPVAVPPTAVPAVPAPPVGAPAVTGEAPLYLRPAG
jgi:hypothetical protein